MRKRMRCVRAMDPCDDGNQLVDLVAENRGIVDFEQPGSVSGGATVVSLEGRGFEIGRLYEVAIDVVAIPVDGRASTEPAPPDAPVWAHLQVPPEGAIRCGFPDEPFKLAAGATVECTCILERTIRIAGIWIPPRMRSALSLLSVRIGNYEQLTVPKVPCDLQCELPGRLVPAHTGIALPGIITAYQHQRIALVVENHTDRPADVEAWIVVASPQPTR